MRKAMLCVLAVVAGAVSTSAVAKDVKQNKQTSTVSTTQMTDSKMDKVAASTFGGAPNLTGSSPTPNTIGIVTVAALAASAAGMLPEWR